MRGHVRRGPVVMGGRQLRPPPKIVWMLCRISQRFSLEEWIDAADKEIFDLLSRYERMSKSPAWLQQSSLDCPAHTRLRNSEEIRSLGNLVSEAVRRRGVGFGFLHRVGVLCSATIQGKKVVLFMWQNYFSLRIAFSLRDLAEVDRLGRIPQQTKTPRCRRL